MSPVPYLRDSRAICLPAQSIRLAQKRLKLLSGLFLYYFSILYLDWPSTGAEVGGYERFFFLLFLALVCRAF